MACRLAPILAALLFVGCAPGWVPLPAVEGVAEPTRLLNEAETLAFRQRIHAFYQRLVRRRFNTLETFNDPVLRDTFRSLDLFFDYYADFAQALYNANFEKSRPNVAVILDFTFDSVRKARVLVRFSGEDGRPMRFGTVYLDRTDRWERADDRWWVAPEQL